MALRGEEALMDIQARSVFWSPINTAVIESYFCLRVLPKMQAQPTSLLIVDTIFSGPGHPIKSLISNLDHINLLNLLVFNITKLCLCTSDNLPQVCIRMTGNINGRWNKDPFNANLFTNHFLLYQMDSCRNIKRSNGTKDSFSITSHKLQFIYFVAKWKVTLKEEQGLQVSANKAAEKQAHIRWMKCVGS
jgi:hypothetical protein